MVQGLIRLSTKVVTRSRAHIYISCKIYYEHVLLGLVFSKAFLKAIRHKANLKCAYGFVHICMHLSIYSDSKIFFTLYWEIRLVHMP